MKEKIKKVITAAVVLSVVYVIGRAKGFFDTVEKYKKDINLDGVKIGLFSAKSESIASVSYDLKWTPNAK
jgi:hypothetical protein